MQTTLPFFQFDTVSTPLLERDWMLPKLASEGILNLNFKPNRNLGFVRQSNSHILCLPHWLLANYLPFRSTPFLPLPPPPINQLTLTIRAILPAYHHTVFISLLLLKVPAYLHQVTDKYAVPRLPTIPFLLPSGFLLLPLLTQLVTFFYPSAIYTIPRWRNSQPWHSMAVTLASPIRKANSLVRASSHILARRCALSTTRASPSKSTIIMLFNRGLRKK